MVLIAPSWHALQSLLSVVDDAANKISMSFNIKKTVRIFFNPFNKHKIFFFQNSLSLCWLNAS